MKGPKLILFVVLVISFITFSTTIYIQPALVESTPYTQAAANGHLVWQQYNCQSCHQLFGLGGYLGPDLTNVYSAPGKGEPYIKAMLKSGTTQMPPFNLSEEDQSALIAFLKQTDASGIADPRNFTTNSTGMTHTK